ncbi:glycosyltransferase family 4 protein [Empedobacter tilapiae]|uniref:Undecaprenyl/decaprenyl-phosphate alpha-N-acetylglucosaminyl 1-phosphate transferase n=1 Tax=Empedobacter tilapiae TaxID=2491114 RepID=A0A4Z1BMV9_9FLAO|nr:MraY family glycosyltransferase [Empedobacter tilapiae]TGN27130.1 undecaprenyl/decaprenyl-phosphate alpha-N-acetylglucosaminyl 1-phosphate transferase [Empedobacter tilapiae]
MGNFKLLEYLYTLSISPIYINVFGAFFFALIITLISIPKIIRISYKKQLMDVPGERSSHVNKVPTLGGVALFFGIVVSTSIFATDLGVNYSFFLSAITILFFIGLMDDLLVVAPDKKLYGQIVSTIFIIFGSGIMINSFSGLFGVYQIPYLLGVVLTTFVFIVLINAYNLIDGIDGLATGVGIVISSCFVYIFYRIFDYGIGILAISTIAVLLGFGRYNLSKKFKIFMGDTGSMVIGFILTFMAIRFLYISENSNLGLKTAPVLLLFIFVIPIVDTLYVFTIRIFRGRSPFSADKNHLHHQFLKLGFNHIKTSIILVIINIFFIIVGYYFRNIEINKLFLIFIVLSISFVLSLRYIVIFKNNKKISL